MKARFVHSGDLTIPDFFLADRGADAKLLVVIHGISRNAAEMVSRFAEDSRFRNFTICAPLFERARFGQYQQLAAKPRRTRSDRALLGLLDVLDRDYGAEAGQICLFGFSGGAQMAHRFAMLHPSRVERVFAASAGWYLMPDTELEYPYGLAQSPVSLLQQQEFLRIPMAVAVGSRDHRIDAHLRQDEVINRIQGRSRTARARNWVAAMQRRAMENGLEPRVELTSLINGTHDFGQCVREAGLLNVAAMALISSNEQRQ